MKKNIKESSDFTNKPSTNTSGDHPVTNIEIKKKDLGDPSVHANINKIDGDKSISVVDEESKPKKYKYLSNCKDSKTGEISQPFSINNKRYQIIRALSPLKERVNAVYSIDECDESGENIIYPLDDFDKNIASKFLKKKEPTLEAKTAPIKDKKDQIESLAGYKFFLVNGETKKFRKFKTAEELAKATMRDGEVFMNLKGLKNFIGETLFGKKKKIKVEETESNEISNEIDNEGDGTITLDREINNFINEIKRKVPEFAYKKIKLNKIAQKKAVIAFSTFLGIPLYSVSDFLTQISNNFDSLSKPSTNQTGIDVSLFNENKIFTKKEITELHEKNSRLFDDRGKESIAYSVIRKDESISEGQKNKGGVPKSVNRTSNGNAKIASSVLIDEEETKTDALNNKIENEIINIIKRNDGFVKRDILTPILYRAAMSDDANMKNELIKTIYQQSIDPRSRNKFKKVVGDEIVGLALQLHHIKDIG